MVGAKSQINRPKIKLLAKADYYTKAKVQKHYHVLVGEDWHYYSVPYRYIGKEEIRKLADYFKVRQEAFNRPYNLI
ncbi:hypothetical protein [Daejeonella sp.]|uniref:hypothetical protein n=1 Tax=Daejeonella sp. TaxID=2805397 RepID=UPI00398398BF